MAIQRSSRALGSPNTIPTTLEVNDETGEASLYVNNGIRGRTLLATADNIGDEWDLKNQFRRRWNAENDLNLSRAEFSDLFNTDISKTLNNDKAFLINTHASNDLRAVLNDAGVPGIKDPSDGTTPGDTTGTPSRAETGTDEGGGGDTNGTSSSAAADGTGSGYGSNTSSLTNITIDGVEGQGMPSGQLRYPSDMSSTMNKLQINILEYSPKGVSSGNDLNINERQKGKSLVTIFLPIPGGIQDQNQVSWSKGDMNALQQAAAEFAVSFIEGGPDTAGAKAEEIAKRIGSSYKEGQTAVANILAGGAAGIGAQLLQRTQGAIINPNAELLFQGPTMRQFGFSYNMSARNKTEADHITLIIRALKQGMSVRRSTKGLFLLSPNLFELKYLSADGVSNPYLNKFKLCAMTGLSVNYTPNQTYMALPNDMPVSYQVDMQFSELEPIFNDDYNSDFSIGY
tara:strand:+ start:43 stop:1410 length:1368 start_codon:yes stop_codon:yes gene_type:complete